MQASVLGLTRAHVAATRAQLLGALARRPAALDLDFARVDALDSTGAALLSDLIRRADAQGCTLRAQNVSASVARALALFPAAAEPAKDGAPAPTPWLDALGDALEACLDWALDAARLGYAVARHLAGALRRPTRAPAGQTLAEMYAVGAQAFAVVGLIAFLVGVTVAMQSAAQLRQFGASIYVVDLVAVAITRELGPLMAAIVVAGRSGSAAAAQIATMVITEEIDALRTMGIDPVRFVVLPKIGAIAATQPMLAVLANAVAIGASLLVALFYLEIAPSTFLDRLWQTLLVKDVALGAIKSVIFGVATMGLAALVGLRTRGGADAVGRSTTVSVVASIFAIILIDAAFSLLFYFEA